MSKSTYLCTIIILTIAAVSVLVVTAYFVTLPPITTTTTSSTTTTCWELTIPNSTMYHRVSCKDTIIRYEY